MTLLTENQIEEFRKLYKKNFNKDISQEEAREKGSKLVELFKAVGKGIVKQDQ